MSLLTPLTLLSSQTFEDRRLVFLAPWESWLVAVVVLLAIGALVLRANSYRGRASTLGIVALVLLRALALGAVVLTVLQPALRHRSVTRVPNQVAILTDSSRSMRIVDHPTGPSRYARSVTMLGGSAARLASWASSHRVESYAFGSSLRRVDLKALSARSAEDEETLIGKALADLRKELGADELGGVVLISDGIATGKFGKETLSAPDREFIKALKAPIHTLWVGDDRGFDISIKQVLAEQFAFVRNAVSVEAHVEVKGLKRAMEIPVLLKREGEVLGQQRLIVRPEQMQYTLKFDFVPRRVGMYEYSVEVPTLAEEILKSNNKRSFLLQVIRDRIRILLICGRPSWDQRFLRRLLKQDPNVDLISFFILRTPASLALVPPSEMSLIPFPTEELFERELGGFDLIVMQNFNYGPYRIGAYLPHIRRYVEQGGGLAMVGGELSFSSGGYYGTPVAEILPVRLLPNLFAPKRLISESHFRLRLSDQGRQHPIMQIGTGRGQLDQLFGALPQLSGTNRVAGLASDATALAVHPTLRSDNGNPMPVVATRQVGKGRSMSLTADSTWHWAFSATEPGRFRGAYERFWRNAVRWLIDDPELQYLKIIVQRHRVRVGFPFRFTLRAYTTDYRPAVGLKVEYDVGQLGENSVQSKVVTTDENGEAHLTYLAKTTGPHRIVARAEIAGRKTEVKTLVLVKPRGPEGDSSRAMPNILKQISEISGGSHTRLGAELPVLKFKEPRVLRVNWRRDDELWASWWWLLSAIVLLGAEWAIRRRLGYL